MARVTDPEVLKQFECALSLWDTTGYIYWMSRVKRYVDEELEGMSVIDVGRLMHEHVRAGGEIDETPETREPYLEHAFHYDFRIHIGERKVYIETRLHIDRLGEPVVYVVNMHDA